MRIWMVAAIAMMALGLGLASGCKSKEDKAAACGKTALTNFMDCSKCCKEAGFEKGDYLGGANARCTCK
jgi:hypothetical protein